MTWKHITQGTGPSQPQRYGAIIEHLRRDQERGDLTLRGPDLAYYLAFAKPGDPLRDWTMVAVTERIEVADKRRLVGSHASDPHICQSCYGRGCDVCGDVGMVCPTCRGARWLTDGKPASNRLALTGCPSCTVDGPGGRTYSATLEARAIQRHLDRAAASAH